MNELCSKGAGELAGMIASGEVTSAEVVDTYLARIEEVNPELNAVTVTLADEARVAASAVDRAVVLPKFRGGGEPAAPVAPQASTRFHGTNALSTPWSRDAN